MNESETSDLVPFSEGEGTKKFPLRKVCVKVYLNELEFIDWVKLAEEAKIRPRGLKPFRLKPHGFAHERLANTKGLVKFIKKVVVPFWKSSEKERERKLQEARRLAEEAGARLEV